MLRCRDFPLGKPLGMGAIDLAHPLFQKLSHIFPLFQDDLIGQDVKNQGKVTFGTGSAQPGWGYSDAGQVLTFNGSQNAFHTASTIPGVSSFPIVLVACGSFNSTASSWPLLGLGRSGSSGGDAKAIRVASSTSIGYVTRENFGTTVTSNITVPTIKPADVFCVIAQSLSATDHRVYVNGKMSTSTTNTGSPASAYDKIGLGAAWTNGSSAPSARLNGSLAFAGVGFQALTDNEALELSANPGLFFDGFRQKRIWVPVSAGSGVSGTLSVQESGSDTSSSTGSVLIQGTIAAQEGGSDSFAATGGVLIQGTLAAQEGGSDTFAASGAGPVTGTLTAQESSNDSFSASGASGSVATPPHNALGGSGGGARTRRALEFNNFIEELFSPKVLAPKQVITMAEAASPDLETINELTTAISERVHALAKGRRQTLMGKLVIAERALKRRQVELEEEEAAVVGLLLL